jgi:hypothetical protein
MLAFSSDPCLRYVLDTPEKLLQGFHAFAGGMGGAALDEGAAWLAEDAAAGQVAATTSTIGWRIDSRKVLRVMARSCSKNDMVRLGRVLAAGGAVRTCGFCVRPQAPASESAGWSVGRRNLRFHRTKPACPHRPARVHPSRMGASANKEMDGFNAWRVELVKAAGLQPQ